MREKLVRGSAGVQQRGRLPAVRVPALAVGLTRQRGHTIALVLGVARSCQGTYLHCRDALGAQSILAG